jgi:hypothetical protein
VEVVATLTLWCLFSMWLLFPYLDVPRMLVVAAGMLAWIELISLITWGLASEDCVHRPCSELAETARLAADTDVPALSAVVLALVIAEAVRRGRAVGRARAARSRRS